METTGRCSKKNLSTINIVIQLTSPGAGTEENKSIFIIVHLKTPPLPHPYPPPTPTPFSDSLYSLKRKKNRWNKSRGNFYNANIKSKKSRSKHPRPTPPSPTPSLILIFRLLDLFIRYQTNMALYTSLSSIALFFSSGKYTL